MSESEQRIAVLIEARRWPTDEARADPFETERSCREPALSGGRKASVLSDAYFEGPKTLEELQANVDNPGPAHDIHHIVEQATAEDNDFPPEQEQSPDNLVRITRYQHWALNRWYTQPESELGGEVPRDYLVGKDWAECRRVGLMGLRRVGALAP